MKRLFLSILAISFSALLLNAQELQELPNDPVVRQGKLENGMTYYIRHNDKPEKRAEFYLATNVGAIQETPDQDGLAHFLEHMCFNGTKNFPGKSLLNYLESIGASFGGNVNASTGVEETRYMLNNIPLLREGVVDSCLLVMHDYSHFVLLEQEEIDNERGVILEERRSRRNAAWRLNEKAKPFIYGDSKYSTCSIIGSQENLQTFKRESIVNFYETWYRPDMQALIVVGDVDVDKIEQKIKTIFADIPAAENPKPKDVITIPGNVEPIVGVITDPETSSVNVEMIWKSDPRPEMLNNTTIGMMLDLIRDIIATVMYERLNDITASPASPFLAAQFASGSMCETMDVAMGSFSPKEGATIESLRTFLIEIEKMKRFGFTDAEVERAKTELLSQYETAANRADSRKNSEFISDLIRNFFDNYPYMDPKVEYQYAQSIIAQLPTQLINQAAAQLITKENFVLIYQGPEKEGFAHPTEAELLAVVNEVENAEIEAPAAEELSSELLDPSKLKGSKVKKSQTIIYGATEWVLKNGVKVILYPTDFEKDRIAFNIYRKGGTSLIATEDLPSFESNLFGIYNQNNGVSQYSATTLSKMLAGKQFAVQPNISELENGFAGTSTVKDFESALQLLYLSYTDPRFDEDAYAQAVSTIETVLPNLVSQPNYKIQKELLSDLYENNPRSVFIDESVLEKASLATIERVTRELYKDAAGVVMILAGDFDVDEIKPLIEKYIGSLPKGKKTPDWIDRGLDISRKSVVNDFKTDMQTPMATVAQIYRTDYPYSISATVLASSLEYILDMVYVETLREEEGGTYGASVGVSVDREPKQYGLVEVSFQTNPSSADKLRVLAKDGLKKIAEQGPTAEQFDKTVKNLQKRIPERQITNSYWMSALKIFIDHGEDFVAEYEAAVNALTPEAIKAFAASFINDGNLIEVVMRPDNAAEAE